jgi:hypothetical protein
MPRNRKTLLVVAGVAVVVAAGAGGVWQATGSIIALRVLWLAGPIALTSVLFLLLQFLLPNDDR